MTTQHKTVTVESIRHNGVHKSVDSSFQILSYLALFYESVNQGISEEVALVNQITRRATHPHVLALKYIDTYNIHILMFTSGLP